MENEVEKLRQDLVKSEEKFRIAFHSNPSIVMISTLDIGQYLEINHNFSQVLGWSREETIGFTSKDLRIFKDFSKRLLIINEINKTGYIRNLELDVVTKQGETKTVEFNADLIDYQGKKCMLAQWHDISDRKLAETTLKRLNEELEIRVKSRTKELEESIHELEAFSYSISHDLKAPLRAINAYCQLCMDENADTLTDINKNRLQKVKEASLYMNQLIDDLLNLYKVKNSLVNYENVDASKIVEEILETLKIAEPERNVEVQIQPGINIWGDAKLIRNILENLLDNAWKFTGPRRIGTIEFGTIDQIGETVYFVRDNGIGFNMAFVNKLFGAFHKLHGYGEYPGTGIGLAIIQRIIHLHHGKIWAESEIEKGATFFFTIPKQF
jgi:PAS domain S-box-containing protein